MFSFGCVSLMAMGCIVISYVLSSDGRDWNFIPLSKKTSDIFLFGLHGPIK